MKPLSHRLSLPLVAVWLAFGAALVAWVRPQAPTPSLSPAKDKNDQLDYMLLDVNGKPRLVRAGQELTVVRGDRLVVKEAVLLGRGKVREVNIVGYQRPDGRGDDRGIDLTTIDLKPRWSESEAGDVYAVTAVGRRTLHGTVYLRLIAPVLRYAEVSINGKRRVLRDGERLTANARDLVKVEKVETNLEGVNDVVFQIVPQEEPAKPGAAPSGKASKTTFEIRFVRGGQAFARIPLLLEGG